MKGKGTRLKLRGGTWYIVEQGNSRGTSTRTEDFELAARLLSVHVRRRERAEKVGDKLTVDAMLTAYLDEHARPNIAAIEQAEISCGYFRIHFGSETPIVALTEEDIATYIKARRERRIKLNRNPLPASDGTIRRELATLGAALHHAVKKRRIPADAVLHIAPPPAPPPKKLWLTPEDEVRSLAACAVETKVSDKNPDARLNRIYRFVMLAMDTAARKEALETLTWNQVDFGTGVIDLNPQGRLQTKKRRSTIPMSARLLAVMERAYGEKTSEHVLDHPGDIRTSMETLTARALMGWITPHVFRHTWATRAARAGVSMVDIADFLGDDARTIERHYRHHSPDYLRTAANWREREKP